jgi:NAD(P)-dependent dehydrogenase (short-subunit alcohol dehydrogenase family)
MQAVFTKQAFTGKVIAVTGGAFGIGRATAKMVASLGAKVSIADLSPDALVAVAKEIRDSGGDVFIKVTDVRIRDAVEAWIKETVETFGRLDGAANFVSREDDRTHFLFLILWTSLT